MVRRKLSRHLHRHRKPVIQIKDQHNIGMLIGLPIVLTIIGLFFIFEASSVTAFRLIGDSYYFLKQQLMWASIGIVVMLVIASIDYRRLQIFAFPSMMISLIFLVAVLIPGLGTDVYGARRWINLGFFSFQPTELTKFASILYLSSWFIHKDKQKFMSFILLLGCIVGLVMVQPDLGTTTILFGLFICTYFLSGGRLSHLLLLIPVGAIGSLILIVTSPYRMRRLLSFLNPTADPEGINYHIRQILISLAAGGIWGRGFSSSRQKYQFLPEAHTDSIFAIIGEEVGFIGACMLIGVYVLLLLAVYRVARKAPDRLGYLLASGVLTLLGLQVVINLGGMVSIMPLTGVPLPFISYGGSSLLVFYGLMGIVISVARRSKSGQP